MIYTKVARILSPTVVILSAGSDDGVREGMEFVIYELSDEITDPETGESLGQLELHKGRVQVLHVQPKLSTAGTFAVRPRFDVSAIYRAALEGIPSTRLEELNVDRSQLAPTPSLTVRVGDAARSVAVAPALLESATK